MNREALDPIEKKCITKGGRMLDKIRLTILVVIVLGSALTSLSSITLGLEEGKVHGSDEPIYKSGENPREKQSMPDDDHGLQQNVIPPPNGWKNSSDEPMDRQQYEPDGKFYTLQRALVESENAEDLALGIESHYHDLGYDVPPGDFGEFEEKSTLTFSYDSGDIDYDGINDLVMHAYCVDWAGCPQASSSIVNPLDPGTPPFVWTEGHDICGTPHVLYGVSGKDRSIVWERQMSRNDWTIEDPESVVEHLMEGNGLGPLIPLNGCFREVVIGTVPVTPDVNGVLIYGFRATVQQDSSFVRVFTGNNHFQYVLEHSVTLIDSRTGDELWVHEETGHAFSYNGPIGQDQRSSDVVVTARNFVIDPFIQIPQSRGVEIISHETSPALFLKGVGFDYTFKRESGPGAKAPHRLVDQYDPHEWAKRINMNDGSVMWEAETFTPEQGRSVWPDSAHLDRRPGLVFIGTFSEMNSMTNQMWGVWDVMDRHWGQIPCCYDQTGDGVPDLAYLAYEWDSMVATSEQDNVVDLKLVVFNGQTGQKHFETLIANDTRFFVHPELGWDNQVWEGAPLALGATLGLAGDLNGDGSDDIIVHKVYRHEDYRNVLSVRSGQTGEEIWSISSPRQLYAMPIGDSSGNGSNDLLVIDWYEWEYAEYRPYHFNNVTTTKLIVHEGATGAVQWEVNTFSAPTDLVYIYRNLLANGLPDLTGDGVADLPIDDPFLMNDLTEIHRMSFIGGKSGKPIFEEITTLGTFAMAVSTGDLVGDGIDDFAILSGDVNDLWLTFYEGTSGEELWSIRVMSPRLLGYIAAEPHIKIHLLDGNSTHPKIPVINMHMYTQTGGEVGGFFRSVETVLPQLLAFNQQGENMWGLPAIERAELAFSEGGTPASKAFLQFMDETAKPSAGEITVGAAKTILPGLALFGLSAIATAVVVGWRLKKQ